MAAASAAASSGGGGAAGTVAQAEVNNMAVNDRAIRMGKLLR